MKKAFLFIFLLCSSKLSFSKDKSEYKASAINEAMLSNANAVVRLDEQEVVVKDLDKVQVKNHFAITILNREGESFAKCEIDFSVFEKVDEAYGFVYDKNGELQYKIKKSDFQIYSKILDAGFYDDSKVMSYKGSFREYPFTVEFYTQKSQNNSFHIPMWVARPYNRMAVEMSTHTVKLKQGTKLFYKRYNTTVEPVVTNEEGLEVYQWAVTNIPAEREEYMAWEEFDGSPIVLNALAEFKLDGRTGNMRTWKDMGLFFWELNKGRNVLTEEKKNKVKQLVEGVDDPYKKIDILYKYMQENTRYVSIQYGIGGWQTLDAAFVCANQYGDCKALCNYMLSMLKEVGITAYPVIVYADREKTFQMPTDFAVNVFNHEILCVPFQNDTVWLECTSKDYPPNYLGLFTDDRDALMLTPEGGVVVHTPKYNASTNLTRRKAEAVCTTNGSMTIAMDNQYSGAAAEHLTRWNYMTEQEKDEYMHTKFHLASPTVSNYKLSKEDTRNMLVFHETANVVAGNMINKSGNYQVVNIDLIPLNLSAEVMVAERKKKFFLPVSLAVSDTFSIALPDNSKIVSLPASSSLDSDFGQFEMSVKEEASRLLVMRKLVLNEGIYEPSQYAKYEEWIDKIMNRKKYSVILDHQ